MSEYATITLTTGPITDELAERITATLLDLSSIYEDLDHSASPAYEDGRRAHYWSTVSRYGSVEIQPDEEGRGSWITHALMEAGARWRIFDANDATAEALIPFVLAWRPGMSAPESFYVDADGEPVFTGRDVLERLEAGDSDGLAADIRAMQALNACPYDDACRELAARFKK